MSPGWVFNASINTHQAPGLWALCEQQESWQLRRQQNISSFWRTFCAAWVSTSVRKPWRRNTVETDQLCCHVVARTVLSCVTCRSKRQMSRTLRNKEKTRMPRFLRQFFGGKLASTQKCDGNISRTTSTPMSSAGEPRTSSVLDEAPQEARSTTDWPAATTSCTICEESDATSASKSVGGVLRCHVSSSQPVKNCPAAAVYYPATPETMLARHAVRPFLDADALTALEELNVFECLVDSLDVIHAAAQHMRYFGVEPARLWDEFFSYVDHRGHNEVISVELWREFIDSKYPSSLHWHHLYCWLTDVSDDDVGDVISLAVFRYAYNTCCTTWHCYPCCCKLSIIASDVVAGENAQGEYLPRPSL